LKNQKSRDTSQKGKKRASIKALENYLDREATLIHKNLDELKNALAGHAAASPDRAIETPEQHVDDYYNSADKLFKEVAIEMDGNLPVEAQWYETLILRKKKKNHPPKKTKGEG